MKTTMKFFALIAIMLGFAIGANAQSGTGTTPAKATVLQAITVTGLIDLNFGTVSPGLLKTIDLVNHATGGQAGYGTESTGEFTVSAAASSNVNLKFTTLPTQLDKSTDHMPIDTYTAGYGVATPFAGTTFIPGTGVNISTFPTNVINSQNLIYVFIGGTVHPDPSQAPGAYASTITLTATYN